MRHPLLSFLPLPAFFCRQVLDLGEPGCWACGDAYAGNFRLLQKTPIFVSKQRQMSQVVLELDNRDDLALLLTLVRRLNIHIVAVRSSDKEMPDVKDLEKRIARMRQAANDPLFLADIEAINTDFGYSDSETPQDDH